jgi:zinc transport system permease protein
MVFLAGGIAHTSYGGIGLAVYFGFPVFFGASAFAVASAILIAFVTMHKRKDLDTIIGLIWAVGMAVGIILVDLTPGYNVDLMSYLFGSILAVSSQDITYMSYLLGLIIVIVVLFYREILAVSYDERYARLRGINTRVFYTLILILSALTIVISIKVVGLILVISLLTIPIYLAQQLSSSLAKMMIISGMLSSIFTIVGLWFSYSYDVTSGASIVMVSAFAMIIFRGFSAIYSKYR